MMIVFWLVLQFFVVLIDSSPVKDDRPGSAALEQYPLIDGHNDFPYNLVNKLKNQINNFDLNRNLSNDAILGTLACDSCATDLERMKAGKVGAQFWVAYVDCKSDNVVSETLEQIDLIKRFISNYPNELQYTTTADGILNAFENKKIGSLIAVEGGHSIDSKLSILRLYYELGVRYMTLTHSCNLPWADASPVDNAGVASVLNLTTFGQKVVKEMNRLGMLVDISHVSHNVMSDAIDASVAPVIFSHSSSYAVFPHHRNVRDDILKKLADNNGVVMVNFYSGFIGDENVTIKSVANHINHIVNVIGVEHVGIGSDYDGVNELPEGLEDVSKYPKLFDLLKKTDPKRWSIENLEKLAGRNLIRVFKQVEKVRDSLKYELPDEDWIDEDNPQVISYNEKNNKL